MKQSSSERTISLCCKPGCREITQQLISLSVWNTNLSVVLIAVTMPMAFPGANKLLSSSADLGDVQAVGTFEETPGEATWLLRDVWERKIRGQGVLEACCSFGKHMGRNITISRTGLS